VNDWIEYGKTFGEFQQEKLNKAGVEIEVFENKELKRWLMGDINVAGGFCDCCGLGYDTVIVRYRGVQEGVSP